MIFFGDFGGLNVGISPQTIFAIGFSPGAATASYSLLSNGQIVQSNTGPNGFWINPQVGMSSYEARATVNAGTLTSGTVGSWVNLGADQTWELTSSAPFAQALFTLQIRPVGGSVVSSASITLATEVF